MAKVKHTKNELKVQRDSQRRYERYLPTLQLKKQQLQLEMRNLEAKLAEKAGEETELRERLAPWLLLFSEPVAFGSYLRIARKVIGSTNVAGVHLPVLEDIEFDETTPDLIATASWVDDGMRVLKALVRLRVERSILEDQHRLLGEELRVTSQRVNLFEKVKIPEARENIRTIRIFLGDQQTAEVARAKMAKGKSLKREGAK